MKRAEKSSRSKGAIGSNAKIPQIVVNYITKKIKVLDYGCGKEQIHVKRLKDLGYKVSGYDVCLPKTKNQLKKEFWDFIYLSNVINTQETFIDLFALFFDLIKIIKPTGKVLLNYPKEPRYISLVTAQLLENILKDFFKKVSRVKVKGYSSPIWFCEEPLVNNKKQD